MASIALPHIAEHEAIRGHQFHPSVLPVSPDRHRHDSACLVQLFVRRHYFSAWMLASQWLKLALCLTLLLRTAADCVAKPFHTKEPPNGHKTDNFNETWFIP